MSLVATLHRKVTDRPPTATTNQRELVHYFDTAPHGVQVVTEGLQVLPFGEFLVEQRMITRYQLFRALQLQDRHPTVRIGECVAALGYVQISEIETAFTRFRQLPTVQAA